VLGALLPASSSAGPKSKYVHDVRVYHQVVGQSRKPQPAEIALLVGGKPIGKLIAGLHQSGKQFAIVDVKGGRVAFAHSTGAGARLSLEVASTCRQNPESRYYVRATARIRGRVRRAYTKGDCSWVVQVLEHHSHAVAHTTFVFEN
jgi:hypothetical protein